MRLQALIRPKILFPTVCGILLISAPPPSGAHGPLDERIEEITRRIEQTPNAPELYWKRGGLHHQNGNYVASMADYEHALRLDPAFHAVHLGRAHVLMELGEVWEALRAAETFLAHDSTCAQAMFIRARAYVELGWTKDAVREMSRAVDRCAHLRPSHYLELGRLLAGRDGAAQGRAPTPSLTKDAKDDRHGEKAGGGIDAEALDRAVRTLDEGMKHLGPVATLQLFAIDLEKERRHFDAALARLDEVAKQYPRNETIYAMRGEILETSGRWIEAEAAYTEALEAIDNLPPEKRLTKSTRALRALLESKLKTENRENNQSARQSMPRANDEQSKTTASHGEVDHE